MLTPAALVQIHKHEPGHENSCKEQLNLMRMNPDQSTFIPQAEHIVKSKQNNSQVRYRF